MQGLKICLRVAGILCLLSVFGVFLPVSAFEAMAGWIGEESFPDSPLFLYMIRAISAMAVGIGVYFVILARKPMNYPVLVPFSGIAAVFVGLTCGITGLSVKMPVLWFIGDSLGCIIIGFGIIFFWNQAKQIRPKAEEPAENS